MNTQKILIAGVIGGVFAFLAGFVIWGLLLKDVSPSGMANVMRGDENMVWWALVVSNLLWGFLLAYIFVQWANISTLQGGAVAGGLLGFLISAAYDTGMYSMTTLFELKDVLMDIITNTVWTALIGAIIGWWLGRRANK